MEVLSVVSKISVAVAFALLLFHAFVWRVYKSRLHLFLTLAWISNFSYLLFETYLGLISEYVSHSTTTILVGVISNIFFGLASNRIRPDWNRVFISIQVLGVLSLAVSLLAHNESIAWTAALYSGVTLIALASAALSLEPTRTYELINTSVVELPDFTNILTGPVPDNVVTATHSQANRGRWLVILGYLGYGLIQFSYPFVDEDTSLTIFSFSFASAMKLLPLVGFAYIFVGHIRMVEVNSDLIAFADEMTKITHGIEHDMRHPLSEIMGTIMVLKENDDDDLQKDVRDLEDAANRISEVMNLILLVRETQADFQRRMIKIGIGTMLTAATEELKARFPGREIFVKVSEPKTAVFVNAYRERFIQALLNILTNSVEATQGKRVVVNVSVQILREEGIVQIQIQDRGSGISSDSLTKVFDAYFSGKKQALIANTGMGLFTAKKIITLHAGEINITSSLDAGTCVTIAVPWMKE